MPQGDDRNDSFLPIGPVLQEAAAGFEPADHDAADAADGNLRRTSAEVPESARRPLAERLRESGGPTRG